jgi:anti-sigma regulatory factor (Ser/Thr protein kinase)
VLRLELDHAPAVVGTARRRAREEVRSALAHDDDIDELLDDVALVVSELVTNSIVHGVPPVVVEVAVDVHDLGCRVVVTCIDSGPWDGTPPDPIRGRGLLLVRALAEVAIDADADGTRVTATLHR